MYRNTRHAIGGKAFCGRKGCAEVPEQGQRASARRKEPTEEATLYDYLIGELTRGEEREAPGIGWESSKSKGASALILCCSLVYRLFEDLQSGRYPNFGSGMFPARSERVADSSLRSLRLRSGRLHDQKTTKRRGAEDAERFLDCAAAPLPEAAVRCGRGGMTTQEWDTGISDWAPGAAGRFD